MTDPVVHAYVSSITILVVFWVGVLLTNSRIHDVIIL